jgi:hypothetical protein
MAKKSTSPATGDAIARHECESTGGKYSPIKMKKNGIIEPSCNGVHEANSALVELGQKRLVQARYHQASDIECESCGVCCFYQGAGTYCFKLYAQVSPLYLCDKFKLLNAKRPGRCTTGK